MTAVMVSKDSTREDLRADVCARKFTLGPFIMRDLMAFKCYLFNIMLNKCLVD